MQELEIRFDNIETLLGRLIIESDRAQRRQEKSLAALEALIARNEQRAEVDRQRAKVDRQRAETERQAAVTDRQRAEADRQRANEDRKLWNKKWGELSDKLGTLVEDIVAPNIPRIGNELLGLKEPDDLMVRRSIRNKKDPSKRREFDVIAVYGDNVLINETKSTVRQDYIDKFVEVLPQIPDYFPEYAGKTIIPIFSSLNISPDLVNYLSKRGIYAMALGEDTMQLLNRAQVDLGAQAGK